MTKLNTNSKKGFTIIEVVLVLAIAGLIFLMVFIALPNLQRTQRDTQRRNDVDRVSSSLIQYIANNNKLPAIAPNQAAQQVVGATAGQSESPWAKFYVNYLTANGNDDFEDPSGGNYNLYAVACTKQAGGTACQDLTAASSPLGSDYSAGTGATTKYTAVIMSNAKCGEDGSFEYVDGTRKFAVAMRLEGNGIYCVEN